MPLSSRTPAATTPAAPAATFQWTGYTKPEDVYANPDKNPAEILPAPAPSLSSRAAPAPLPPKSEMEKTQRLGKLTEYAKGLNPFRDGVEGFVTEYTPVGSMLLRRAKNLEAKAERDALLKEHPEMGSASEGDGVLGALWKNTAKGIGELGMDLGELSNFVIPVNDYATVKQVYNDARRKVGLEPEPEVPTRGAALNTQLREAYDTVGNFIKSFKDLGVKVWQTAKVQDPVARRDAMGQWAQDLVDGTAGAATLGLATKVQNAQGFSSDDKAVYYKGEKIRDLTDGEKAIAGAGKTAGSVIGSMIAWKTLSPFAGKQVLQAFPQLTKFAVQHPYLYQISAANLAEESLQFAVSKTFNVPYNFGDTMTGLLMQFGFETVGLARAAAGKGGTASYDPLGLRADQAKAWNAMPQWAKDVDYDVARTELDSVAEKFITENGRTPTQLEMQEVVGDLPVPLREGAKGEAITWNDLHELAAKEWMRRSSMGENRMLGYREGGRPGIDTPAEPPMGGLPDAGDHAAIMDYSSRALGTTPEALSKIVEAAGNNTTTISAALTKAFGDKYTGLMQELESKVDAGAPLGTVDFVDPIRRAVYEADTVKASPSEDSFNLSQLDSSASAKMMSTPVGKALSDAILKSGGSASDVVKAAGLMEGGSMRKATVHGEPTVALNRSFEIPQVALEDIASGKVTEIAGIKVDPGSISDVLNGKGTGIEGEIREPVQLFFDTKSGDLSLQNGYHRLVETIRRGGGSLPVEVTFGENPKGQFYTSGFGTKFLPAPEGMASRLSSRNQPTIMPEMIRENRMPGVKGDENLRVPEEPEDTDVVPSRLSSRAPEIVPDSAKAVPEPPRAETRPEGTGEPPALSSRNKAFEPPEGKKARSYPQTVEKAKLTSPEVAEGMRTSPDRFYDPITNKGTLEKAQAVVDADPVAAYSRVVNETGKGGNATAETFAVAQELARRYQNEGNHAQAIDVIERTARKATEQGQAIQALSMWQRLTPEGALELAVRRVNEAESMTPRTTRKLKEAEVISGRKLTGLDPETAAKIKEMAEEAQAMEPGRAKDIKTAQMLAFIDGLVPPTLGQKISTFQTMMMLLNPKTVVRNIIGNLGLLPAEEASNLVAVPVDAGLSYILRTPRTKAVPAWLRGDFRDVNAFAEGFMQGAEEGWKGVDTRGTSDRYLGLGGFKKARTTFTDPILGTLEKTMNVSLRAPDRAFYERAFYSSMENQMRAQGVDTPTPLIIEEAHYDGMRAIFENDSTMRTLFSKTKSALNTIGTPDKAFGAGDVLLKFPGVPANIISRGLEFSPLGYVKSLVEASRPLFGQEFSQKRFSENFARATVGSTGLIATGYQMAKVGIITGAPPEDSEINATQRALGMGQYKINASALKRYVASGFSADATKARYGDTLVSYDWFQPHAIGMSMGANIYMKQKVDARDLLSTMMASTEGGIQTIEEQPLMSALRRLSQGDRSVVNRFMESMKDAPATFVPTFLNQVGQFVDNYSRETYDPNPAIQAYNIAINKIPGLREKLPVRINPDTALPQERFQNDSNTLFNVFLNPAFVTKIQKDPVLQEVLGIYNRTGETKQAPKIAPRSVQINGETRQLSGLQISQYQRYLAKETRGMYDWLMSQSNYSKLGDEEKAKILSDILTGVNQAAKVDLFGDQPKSLSTYAQMVLLRRRNGQ